MGPFWVDARPGPGPAGNPRLPGGLNGFTEYWVIRINNNEIRLAESREEAMSASPDHVNLTSPGAGTRILTRRFTGLTRADRDMFTVNDDFITVQFVPNAVNPTRMAIGLTSVYVSRNIGTGTPAYDAA
jgi:hypothetical protein